MTEPEPYGAVVIGSGEGGNYFAWHLAKAGQRTAVIERRWIGGSCPNINCLPSKNEIWSAGVAHTVSRAGAFGVTSGPIAVEMAKVLARKRDMVDGLVAVREDVDAATPPATDGPPVQTGPGLRGPAERSDSRRTVVTSSAGQSPCELSA